MKRPLFFKVIVFTAGLLVSSNNFAQSISFGYTGVVQTYLVPKDVTGITVDLQGASGGSSDFSRGGYGGRVQCRLDVTPGNVLYIYAGGAGANSKVYSVKGGYNGGASGSALAGGGGGASDIRIGGTSLSNRVVVAGGGGGGSTVHARKDYDRGGDGGGMAGENGYYFSGNSMEHGGGGGITRVAGDRVYASRNSDGKPGNKGDGYDDDASFGGGGGGYEGGNGGGSGPYGGGGGGGSSFGDPALTSFVIHNQGYNTERDGKIIITPVFQVVTLQQ